MRDDKFADRVDSHHAGLKKLTKAKLIAKIVEQQQILSEKDKQISELTEQLAQQQDDQKQKDINKTVNQPTSKKPEWD